MRFMQASLIAIFAAITILPGQLLAKDSHAKVSPAKASHDKAASRKVSTQPGWPSASGLSLDRLPAGKNVTMPRPATTFVPLAARVVLTGTDLPQTLSFRPINLSNGSLRPIRLAIFDQNSERDQYVHVSPNTPFLYPVKDLAPITVIPEASGDSAVGLHLQIESDKPLDIAH